MKRIANIFFVALTMALPAVAQVSVSQPEGISTSDKVVLATTIEELTDEEMNAIAEEAANRPRLTYEILAEEQRRSEAERTVAILPMGSRLSRLDMETPFYYHNPWTLGGPSTMALHEGLNVEVGFSVSSSLGSNRMKGAGFGEHIAAAYAMPFDTKSRWMGAFGVYADRLDWGGYNRTEAGISGLIGYRVNDWCNLYVYGQYNFVPGRDSGPNPYAYSYASCSPFGYGYPYRYGYGYPYGCGYGYPYGYGYDPYCSPYGPYANLKGRIGAAAEFKIGESGHLTISVEHSVYDNGNMWPVAPPPMVEAYDVPFSASDAPNSMSRGGNRRW